VEPEEARSLIEQGIACVNARDIDGVLELVHPDSRWLAPPGANSPVYAGREGVRQFISEWLEAWDGFHQELFELELVGDRALARVRARARGEGSGVELDADIGYVVRFADGLLVSLELFTKYDDALAKF
jgi:ketosteroid isomerase-like protein